MLFYVSDLHAEIRGSTWRSHFEKFVEENFNNLHKIDIILAGDNGSFLDFSLKNVIDAFAGRLRHVQFCLGNHEYYGLCPEIAIHKASELQNLFQNVTFLHRTQVETADGILLWGATLWSDASQQTPKEHWDIEGNIGDFHKIQVRPNPDNHISQVPLFWNTDLMTAEHQKDLRFLEDALQNAPQNKKKVVVTHFAPVQGCNPKEYSNSKYIKQFCNELDTLIQKYKPDAWIQGHVHGGNEIFQKHETKICRACLGQSFEHVQGSIAQLELD